jgi:gas vesicle protein
MGKVSLSRPQPPTPEPTPEPKKLIPKLTKKELINVVVYTGGVLLIGFVIGLLSHPLFTTTHVVRFRSEFDQIQLDLENKLESTSKKLDGIEDEELRKLLTDAKKEKIDEIKKQLEELKSFRSKQFSEIKEFCEKKKNELKQKEILYNR